MSYLNDDQVYASFYNESADLMHAEADQIERVSARMEAEGDHAAANDIHARWDDLQEEMRVLWAEARHEFEMGY